MSAEYPLLRFRLFFHPRERYLPCRTKYVQSTNPIKVAESVLYVSPRPYSMVHQNGTRYAILNYVMVYQINDGIHLLNQDILPMMGHHSTDIECVTVLYDRNTKKPVYLYFSAHTGPEGQWHKFDEVVDSHGVVNVYVARGSHANYAYKPNSATARFTRSIERIFGTANDEISNEGVVIMYSADKNNIVPATPDDDKNIPGGSDREPTKKYIPPKVTRGPSASNTHAIQETRDFLQSILPTKW